MLAVTQLLADYSAPLCRRYNAPLFKTSVDEKGIFETWLTQYTLRFYVRILRQAVAHRWSARRDKASFYQSTGRVRADTLAS